MNIRDQIPPLETLSDIDERLRLVDEELKLRRGGLASLRDEVVGLASSIESARASVATMEKTRNEIHVEVRQMTSQIEKSREKLARSRNERETVAAQREMEELRRLVRDREDEMSKLDGLAERARTSADESDARRAALTREIEGDAEGAAQTLAAHEKERAELVAQREAAQKALPVLLYRRYESIRTRRPKAIARTHDGTCNGCHIAVPPMMFQKIMRLEEFEQCPNCRRLLYYAPATPGAPEQPA